MKKLFAFSITVTITVSAAIMPAAILKAQQQKTFSISGSGATGKYIYIAYNGGRLDSAEVTAGKYQLKGELTQSAPAMLFSVSPVIAAARNPKNRLDIFLEPGSIKITHIDSFTHVSFENSLANTEYAKLKETLDPLMAKNQQLQTEYRAAYNEGDTAKMEAIMQESRTLARTIREGTLLTYAQTNPNSPIALFALENSISGDLDPATIGPVFDKLAEAQRNNEAGQAFQKRIEASKKTAIGSVAPDFTQSDTAGNPVKLASFRGSYTLVDFWASWCGPCRMENPKVVAAYNKYKAKGFKILGVSLDRPDDKAKWLDAIHKDQLTWTQVSDLKFWDNEVAKAYGINAIPQNFLLDPQGRIIARSLRGDDLDRRLAELYK